MENNNNGVPIQELDTSHASYAKNNKSKNYHLYMNALQEFYEMNYYQSQRTLFSARPYFNDLDQNSSWIAIDNMMLSILICLIQKDFQLLQSEIAKLKRTLKKNYVNESAQKELKNVYKIAKVYFNDYKAEPLVNWLHHLQKEHQILRNVEIDISLF